VVDRAAAARWQINVADVQDAIQTAVGGNALTQVLHGEERYNLTLRYLPQYRDTREAIENIRLLSPSGERVSLAQLCKVREPTRARRSIAKQRALCGHQVQRARPRPGRRGARGHQKVNAQVKLPRGYHIGWEGEYQSELRAAARMAIIRAAHRAADLHHPVHHVQIVQVGLLILATVAMASVGGLLVLLVTGTKFSVSSEVGFLALFGVSVQTGVIMLEYINQLRARGHSIEDRGRGRRVVRLRPIMMTMLVATLGLLPAAMSRTASDPIRSGRLPSCICPGGLMPNLDHEHLPAEARQTLRGLPPFPGLTFVARE
jgi:heavy metal efflux system protein